MKAHQVELLKSVEGLKPGRVLDAGSGSGILGDSLSKMGFEVFSLDLYDIPKHGHFGRFVRADLNRPMPFAGSSFDYILCSESLQYLENHSGVFREFRRALRPDGRLILTIPNLLNAASRLYFLQRGYFPSFKPVRTMKAGKGWDFLAYNPLSFIDIVEFAGRSGMELVAFKGSGVKGSSLPLYPILKALYSAGLLFEKNPEKSRLIKRLSSSDLLLCDHVIMQFGPKAA